MLKIISRFTAAAMLAFALAAAAAPSTYTGVLTDSMCTKKHMMPGHSTPECVRECIKGGAKYALASEGKAYELKGDSKLLDKFAGQAVTVKGSQSGSAIIVTDIARIAQ